MFGFNYDCVVVRLFHYSIFYQSVFIFIFFRFWASPLRISRIVKILRRAMIIILAIVASLPSHKRRERQKERESSDSHDMFMEYFSRERKRELPRDNLCWSKRCEQCIIHVLFQFCSNSDWAQNERRKKYINNKIGLWTKTLFSFYGRGWHLQIWFSWTA